MKEKRIKMSTRDREKLLASVIREHQPITASQVIDIIWDSCDDATRIDHGWRFFVHLNKSFTTLEKRMIIKCVAKAMGLYNKGEKMWGTYEQ
jgi:hypothetical protein